MQEREDVKAFDASYEPGYFPQEDFSSSPPQFDKEQATSKISRMPSFLSETTEGNEALRSLYLPYNCQSDSTLPKLSEETNDGMDSPRLSILSESSFLSVYGNKLPPLSLDEPEEPRRHRKSSSVEKWVDDRPEPAVTPPKAVPSLRKSQFLSINDVLESPLQRLEKLKHTLEKTEKGLNSTRDITFKDRRRPREVRQVSTEKKSFDRQHTLPPTPDTIGTNTLRNFRSSTETLSQNHVDSRFLNSTSTFPNAAHHAFQSQISIRPRSAGETVTSRREGHGWDTPSQEDNTDSGSVFSTLSTHSAQYGRRKRVVAPDLFSFSGGDWGRGYEPTLPAHTASRHDTIRRSSFTEHPRSDDTVTTYRYDDSPQYGTIPIDTTPKPEFPDRRSSLSAVTKLRKSNPGPAQPHNESAVSKEKKSRIPNLRMFGRGESAPPPSSPTKTSLGQCPPRPKVANASRSSGYFAEHVNTNGAYEEEDQARATPPPIMRSRPQSYRPVSSAVASRRGGSFVDEQEQGQSQGYARRDSMNGAAGNDGGVAGKDEESGKSKKWFGLARANSLRRH
ncbi:hypothetical protein ONS95_004098 [Cadophora gregata]|nr:uncharacterized protein ONS95_004098 [Cadophora gregata]KAK0105566.1 hypothetical protein ONS95_004098 [Cadophora gregata]